MPDTGSKSATAFLKEKAGPLPIGIWLVILAGMVYYIRTKQGGGSLFGGSGAGEVPNQQKDPAGNIGSIDPATGYVYGTPEDNAALAANNAGVSSTGGGGGSTGTVAGQYQDNGSWGRAAINYLVGLGVDPAGANEAIQLYLSSQPLTTQQQGDVNLAIQGLGAPPQPPGPVGNTPPPVTTPPGTTPGTPNPPPSPAPKPSPGPSPGGGGGKAPPAVTGLHATQVTSTSIGLAWSKSQGATGYQVRVTYQDKVVKTADSSGTSYNVTGLTPDHTYGLHVVAKNSSGQAPEASITQKTNK